MSRSWGAWHAVLPALMLSSVLGGCSVGGASPAAAEDVPRAAPAAPCPRVGAALAMGRVASDELDEVSGAVASRKVPGVYWVHNDSGDSARLFAIDIHGRTLAELTLRGAHAEDIEDIARMPGTGSGPDLLYVADTGNNMGLRGNVQLYRVEEPTIDLEKRDVELERKVQVIDVSYEDGRPDVETLLGDPISGDLFLVTKSRRFLSEQPVPVYRLAAQELARGKAVARKVAVLQVGPATAGDVAVDGSFVMVRNYWSAFYWARAKGETLAQVFTRAGCRLPVADVGKQGESLAIRPDGRAFISMPEGLHALITQQAFE